MGRSAKRAVFAVVLVAAAACMVSGQSTSGTGTGPNLNPSGIETEVVTITDDGAVPNTISRTQVQFFLLLINKTYRKIPNFYFDSTTASAVQIPIIGQALNLSSVPNVRSLASIFNPPAGVYQLKWQADGSVLLTINIGQ
jgi:hypothetical protein